MVKIRFSSQRTLYFEKLPHSPTLKILDFSSNVVWTLFAKVLDREITCLTAWRVPESLGWPKKFKNVKIWPNNMTLCTDKTLKSKNLIFLYISQGYRFKKKIWNQSKKYQLEKNLFFWVTLIQAVVSKRLAISYSELSQNPVYRLLFNYPLVPMRHFHLLYVHNEFIKQIYFLRKKNLKKIFFYFSWILFLCKNIQTIFAKSASIYTFFLK